VQLDTFKVCYSPTHQQGHYQYMQPHHHWFNHALMDQNWPF